MPLDGLADLSKGERKGGEIHLATQLSSAATPKQCVYLWLPLHRILFKIGCMSSWQEHRSRALPNWLHELLEEHRSRALLN